MKEGAGGDHVVGSLSVNRHRHLLPKPEAVAWHRQSAAAYKDAKECLLSTYAQCMYTIYGGMEQNG